MSRRKEPIELILDGIFGFIGFVILSVPKGLFSLGRFFGINSKRSDGVVVFNVLVMVLAIPAYMFFSGDIDLFKGEKRSIKRIANKGKEKEDSNFLFYLSEFFMISLAVGYVSGASNPQKRNSTRNNMGKAISITNKRQFLNDPAVQESLEFNHQLVLGSSGAGKSFFVLEGQIRDAIERGEAIFIIDPKGDVDFRDAVFSWCVHFGRDDAFRYFSMSDVENSHKINPFGDCKPNEIKDMIISATDWSEPHYRKMAEVSILKALQNRENDSKVTISEIIELLPDSRELTGLKADLELMKISEYGKLIDNQDGDSIFDYYRENKVVFVSLDVQAYPQSSVQLGRILMGAILSLSNRVQSLCIGDRKKTTLVVDEFGSFLTDSFVNFINKARSSNFRALLATQSVGDLERYSPEMRKQLLDSITNKVVLRMSDPDSIEFCARMFGTQTSAEVTKQIENKGIWGTQETGVGSAREVEKFIVHPKEIRELETGVGYVLVQNPYGVFKTGFFNPRFEEFREYEYVMEPQKVNKKEEKPTIEEVWKGLEVEFRNIYKNDLEVFKEFANKEKNGEKVKNNKKEDKSLESRI